MAILQRFRSGNRDQDTDSSRFAALHQAFETAIAEASRERDGLKRRAERAGSDAAFLIDGDTGSRGLGAAEGRIDSAEQTIRQAERRLGQLDIQIAGLQDLMAGLGRLAGPG